jgi:hypothetical protein
MVLIEHLLLSIHITSIHPSPGALQALAKACKILKFPILFADLCLCILACHPTGFGRGTCIDKAHHSCGHSWVPGYCAGAASVVCCAPKLKGSKHSSRSSGAGKCIFILIISSFFILYFFNCPTPPSFLSRLPKMAPPRGPRIPLAFSFVPF